jgi:hypothetical protein
LGSGMRHCPCSSSRVVFHPSLAVLSAIAFVVVCFDWSSTTSLLRLHLQTNDTCDILLFARSSCSASTYSATTCLPSSCCSAHLLWSSYTWW